MRTAIRRAWRARRGAAGEKRRLHPPQGGESLAAFEAYLETLPPEASPEWVGLPGSTRPPSIGRGERMLAAIKTLSGGRGRGRDINLVNDEV